MGFSLPGIGDLLKAGKEALGTDKGKELVSAAQFKKDADGLERTLAKIEAPKLGLKEGEASPIVEFMQRALKGLGQGNVTVDGKVTPEFLQELNGYIVAKREEKDLFGDYKGLKTVDAENPISGAHLQALVDSLRDKDILKADSKRIHEFLGKALQHIDDADMKKTGQALAPDYRPPAAAKRDDAWSAAPTAVAVPTA